MQLEFTLKLVYSVTDITEVFDEVVDNNVSLKLQPGTNQVSTFTMHNVNVYYLRVSDSKVYIY